MVNFGPLAAEICWRVWGTQHFQRVSFLGFVTAATSLNGRQPNFARCLAQIGRLLGWYTLGVYIHFRDSCPLTEFCQLQNSLSVQVLHSPILAALLHGTWAVGVSQTLQRDTRIELQNFRSSSFSTEDATYIPRAAITLGIGTHCSCYWGTLWHYCRLW